MYILGLSGLGSRGVYGDFGVSKCSIGFGEVYDYCVHGP